MAQRLKGKSAVVTGGGGGIGRSVALAMAAEGASVVVNDLGSDTDGTRAADKVVGEIKKAQGTAVANYDSVTTILNGEKIIKTAISNFNRIDILVQCAGNIYPVPTVDMTQDQWDSTIAVHVGGHFSCGKAAAKVMIQQKSGCIINVASRGAFPPFPMRGTAYATAKSGIMGFTTALSQELKQDGIRVNCILPNATTKLFPGTTPRGGGKGGGNMPATPGLDPDDIAPMFVYLATDEAKNITGQFIYLAGGDFAIYPRPLLQPSLYVRKIGKWTVDEIAGVIPSLGLD